MARSEEALWATPATGSSLIDNLLLDPLRSLWVFCKRRPLGAFGLALLVFLVVAALLVPYVSPYGVNARSFSAALKGPSQAHPFGTDNLGRDVLTRVLYGGRLSLGIGLAVTVVASGLGMLFGVISGFYGGKVDRVFVVLADATMSFPALILAIALVAALGASVLNVILALVAPTVARTARVVRAAALGVSNRTYIEASRSIGCGNLRIALRHVVPNVFPTVIVLASLTFAGTILAESTLSFLGLGPPPPTPTWGRMLASEGRSFFRSAPWLSIWPGVALAMAVYGLNLLGDALRDHLDPRLRGS